MYVHLDDKETRDWPASVIRSATQNQASILDIGLDLAWSSLNFFNITLYVYYIITAYEQIENMVESTLMWKYHQNILEKQNFKSV